MIGTTPRLRLSVQYAVPDRNGLPDRLRLRRWARAALEQDVEVTLRFVSEDEGRQLNRDFRGKDYPTNVLTFPYGEDEAGQASGDIVLCAGVIAREADERGKALTAHYAHMVVHGMLHLQGYDHQQDREATAMEAVERFILRRLGFPDPYL